MGRVKDVLDPGCSRPWRFIPAASPKHPPSPYTCKSADVLRECSSGAFEGCSCFPDRFISSVGAATRTFLHGSLVSTGGMPIATTLSRRLPAWAHGIPTNTAAAPEEIASPLSISGTTAQTRLHSFYEFLCFLLLNSTSLRF